MEPENTPFEIYKPPLFYGSMLVFRGVEWYLFTPDSSGHQDFVHPLVNQVLQWRVELANCNGIFDNH